MVGELEKILNLRSLKSNNTPKQFFKDQLAQFQLKLDPDLDQELFKACSDLRKQLEKQWQQADRSSQNSAEQ